MLEDIAILTGGKAIFEDLGIQLENVQLKDLGRAKKIKIDKENTVVIEGAGKKADIRAASASSRRSWKSPPAITTRKSCPSASPSCRAGGPRSTSAPPPKAR